MHHLKAITLITSILAATSSVAAEVSREVLNKMQRDINLMHKEHRLVKRNCTDNGCKCRPGTPQGQYCGLCMAVTNAGEGGFYTKDIFECNASGGCCNFGESTKCSGDNWSDWCPK